MLAVIPARAGSRGIPHKNMVDLCGKPLIQWTLDAVYGSLYVDRIVVTTDDPQVRKLALDQGLDVIDRPPEIADDAASAAQVIAHVLRQDPPEEVVLYLQPTSPLREAGDLDSALELLVASSAEGIVAVTVVSEHPEWMYRIGANDFLLNPVLTTPRANRRQDLPKSVRLNGAIYCAPAELLRPDGDIFRLRLAGYEMPRERSVDIDFPSDLASVIRILDERR